MLGCLSVSLKKHPRVPSLFGQDPALCQRPPFTETVLCGCRTPVRLIIDTVHPRFPVLLAFLTNYRNVWVLSAGRWIFTTADVWKIQKPRRSPSCMDTLWAYPAPISPLALETGFSPPVWMRWSGEAGSAELCYVLIAIDLSTAAQFCPQPTGYTTHLQWRKNPPCWHPSGESLLFVCRLCCSCVFLCRFEAHDRTHILLHLQTQHTHGPADQTDQAVGGVGPQAGRLLCGQLVAAPVGAGVPPKRPTAAPLCGRGELQHGAVGRCFPPVKECLRRRQRVRAPAGLLRLRWCMEQ